MSSLIRLKVATLQSSVRSSPQMVLSAKVKNVTYSKGVFVHYKAYPFWQDMALAFQKNYGDYDIFEYHSTPGVTPYFNEFDLYCQEGNQTDWDNNDGRNYLLNSDQSVVGGNVVMNSTYARVSPVRGGGASASVSGEIYVNNRSYGKQVGIMYSVNGTSPWVECDAIYKGPVLYYGAESWEFNLPQLKIDNTISNNLKFAVFYKNLENNVTYWDNNFNQDYKLPLIEGSEIR